MSPVAPRAHRRELTLVVLATAAAAALTLWAVSRTWSMETIPRPAPFPAERAVSGGPAWLTACGLVALAAAGALVAARGFGRRLVGVLLAMMGIGVAVSGGVGLVTGKVVAGPLVAILAGLVLTACGGLAAVRERKWPVMGARYERSVPNKRDIWDALDRGEDPTAG
jgi:hypothetical protein